jgi:radical SAM protein with 4Fe4S-binding SPASM domain
VLWRDKYLEYNEFCLDLFREGSTICPVDRRNLFTSYRRRYRKPSRLACGAAFIKAAIDTNGDIYPCESFVHPDFVLGNVHEGWDAIKLGGFTKMLHEKGAIKSDRRECVGCFAKHVCGGGCYAMNWDVMGKINEIILERCEFIREKVKIDLYYLSEMQALESQERRVSP